jgi:hypothetical protein
MCKRDTLSVCRIKVWKRLPFIKVPRLTPFATTSIAHGTRSGSIGSYKPVALEKRQPYAFLLFMMRPLEDRVLLGLGTTLPE